MNSIMAPYLHPNEPDFWSGIDPEIRECVRLFLCLGFSTIQSCAGHDDPQDTAYRDGQYRTPYIRIGARLPCDLGRLLRLLADAADLGILFDIVQAPRFSHAPEEFVATAFVLLRSDDPAHERRWLIGRMEDFLRMVVGACIPGTL